MIKKLLLLAFIFVCSVSVSMAQTPVKQKQVFIKTGVKYIFNSPQKVTAIYKPGSIQITHMDGKPFQNLVLDADSPLYIQSLSDTNADVVITLKSDSLYFTFVSKSTNDAVPIIQSDDFKQFGCTLSPVSKSENPKN